VQPLERLGGGRRRARETREETLVGRVVRGKFGEDLPKILKEYQEAKRAFS